MRRGTLLALGLILGFVALSEKASAAGPVITPAVVVKAANSPTVAAPIQPVRHRYYGYRPYYGQPYYAYRPYRAYYRPYYRPRYYGYYGPGAYYGGPTIYGAPGVYGYYGY